MYKIISLLAPGRHSKNPNGLDWCFELPKPSNYTGKRKRALPVKPRPDFSFSDLRSPLERLNAEGINGSLMNVKLLKKKPPNGSQQEVVKVFIPEKWDSTLQRINKRPGGDGQKTIMGYFEVAQERYQILNEKGFPVARCSFDITGKRNASIISPLFTRFLDDEPADIKARVLAEIRDAIPTNPANEFEKMFVDAMPRNIAYSESNQRWELVDVFDNRKLYISTERLEMYFSNTSEWSS